MKPGLTVAQARTQMAQVAGAIAEANPGWSGNSEIGVRPLGDHLVGGSVRSWMLMMLAAVSMVLVIACTNVANLLLARATARQRDVAVRAALGASRRRLLRLFLAESVLLSTTAAVASLGLAWSTIHLLKSALPDTIPRAASIGLDLRVLGAAWLVALVVSALFGLVPAWQSSRLDLSHALNQSTRASGTSRGRQRMRQALVVAEIALAVVLVVGSTLFISSFMRVMRIDSGMRPAGVLTMQIAQRPLPGQPPPNLTNALSEIVSRVDQIPGVTSVAVATPGIPLRLQLNINGLALPG